ncbi:phosphatase PAP2 family protein [Streptomyces sp. NPDC046465]|uniref:phosphatase PAP2 family protein n=1 Tax=Streptomyces sp. NPDC046465 TaxID=3155810 RepID=UPI0033D80494
MAGDVEGNTVGDGTSDVAENRALRRYVADLAWSAGLGAWVAFGVLTMVVIGHDGAPLTWDGQALSWSVGHRPASAIALARGLTATGTGVIPYALAALAGIVVGRTVRRRLVGAALAVGCLASGQAMRYGVMALVDRRRPPHMDWRTHASSFSFPSGHTTTAALAAGLLAIALVVRAPRGRTPLAVAVGCWGVLVGLTRIYLGVHWLTDVVGGWLFSAGWLGLCLCAAVWWLPDRFVEGTTRTTTGSLEDHAPQDPDRGGRSRPA